jgi:L-lysine exporter family protein LysE/ArgO
MPAFPSGFLLGLSLIVAIGAQNAFVLRQGLRREHVLAVALTCALSDAILIAIGVSGYAEVTARAPALEPALRFGGAVFLIVYGALRFRAALIGGEGLSPASGERQSLRSVLATCLALTWLNPHVYLDTVLLIGSISTQYPGQTAAFATGAMTASFVFFFSLAYGARALRPLFARPATWRVLEAAIGLLMWAIAASLVIG